MELRCTGREGRLPAGWGRKGTAARIAGWKAVIQSARLLQGRSPVDDVLSRCRPLSPVATHPMCSGLASHETHTSQEKHQEPASCCPRD